MTARKLKKIIALNTEKRFVYFALQGGGSDRHRNEKIVVTSGVVQVGENNFYDLDAIVGLAFTDG